MTDSSSFAVVLAFALGTSLACYSIRVSLKRRRKPRLVGTVDSLWIYPVKSCVGLEFKSAKVDNIGIYNDALRDRHFAVLSSLDNSDVHGQVLTQRMVSKMALVQPSVDIECQNLILKAPEMPDLTIPLRVVGGISKSSVRTAVLWGQRLFGVDCGPSASVWWKNLLKREADVWMMQIQSDNFLKDVSLAPEFPPIVAERLGDGEKAGYTDWSPMHIANLASLDALNKKIVDNGGDGTITMRNFRPNLIIKTDVAFEEDDFDRVFIMPQDADVSCCWDTASVIMRNVKLCTRCVLTTVDPNKGEVRPDKEPLQTLKTFRMRPDEYGDKSPLFGINTTIERPGNISAGDLVYVM